MFNRYPTYTPRDIARLLISEFDELDGQDPIGMDDPAMGGTGDEMGEPVAEPRAAPTGQPDPNSIQSGDDGMAEFWNDVAPAGENAFAGAMQVNGPPDGPMPQQQEAPMAGVPDQPEMGGQPQGQPNFSQFGPLSHDEMAGAVALPPEGGEEAPDYQQPPDQVDYGAGQQFGRTQMPEFDEVPPPETQTSADWSYYNRRDRMEQGNAPGWMTHGQPQGEGRRRGRAISENRRRVIEDIPRRGNVNVEELCRQHWETERNHKNCLIVRLISLAETKRLLGYLFTESCIDKPIPTATSDGVRFLDDEGRWIAHWSETGNGNGRLLFYSETGI